MTAVIMDGKSAADVVLAQVKKDVDAFRARAGRAPGLTVVLAGDDPASAVYVRNKHKRAEEVGMRSEVALLPNDAGEARILHEVERLNRDPAVDGILVQLPLPGGASSERVLNAISPEKDVDGFHPVNMGALATGGKSLVPCTPKGCVMLLKQYVGDLSGKHAVVVGRSNIVGKPVSLLLLAENCTVTVAHSRTKNLEEVVRAGDIVVAAVGRPEMVRGSWIKPGAAVVDVGINRMDGSDGKSRLVGDVCFAEAVERAAYISPVPGGVGPMTIACLLQNTLEAAAARHNEP
ncbi:MAG: bifunctional methylenetetrahydrofolate dehydrogenase/methenyltetrahydrofolate cyclohydrolase FolD [Rickettsiales bacterium]